MFLTLLLGAGAAALGVARGGSLQRLAETSFRGIWLLFAGFGAQIALELWSPAWLTEPISLFVVILANVAVVAFLCLNRALPGVTMMMLGTAMNVIVIAGNGGMPVSPDAADFAGVPITAGDTGPKHQVLDPGTTLPWLADVIPIPRSGSVLSAGDLVLMAGVARLVYVQTRTVPRRQRARAVRRPAVTPPPPPPPVAERRPSLPRGRLVPPPPPP
ncbi:MAG: DUF5317 domain-containing protein [Actinomycetota bacterium]|nr:DUF5317 domain-containing protein [Actinomycetota bacterium]